MKTSFDAARLQEPAIAEANTILRACVHCGFCNSACPTYALTGDERDGPRGRIWLIRDLLETDGPPADEAVFHLDRCIECLACMPACPSGVDYRHLVGIARNEISARVRRPLIERILRGVMAVVLTHPARLRAAAMSARALVFLAPVLPRRLAAPLRLAARLPVPGECEAAPVIAGTRKGRIALLGGCVQQVTAPGIDAALARVLARAGMEAVVLDGAACCGALDKHLGRADAARAKARDVIAALARADADGRVDAVIQTSSGCGALMKDYGHLLAGDPQWAAKAKGFAARVRDASEVLAGLDLPFRRDLPALDLAWQAPCSLTNAQRISAEPVALMRAAGFRVGLPADGGRCCGAGGVYNALEPEMAGALARHKAEALAETGGSVIVSANVGCMVQLAGHADAPVVHLVELLDWATGGPEPGALRGFADGR
jgi:glycolate oxidase iron-sulfur subunit